MSVVMWKNLSILFGKNSPISRCSFKDFQSYFVSKTGISDCDPQILFIPFIPSPTLLVIITSVYSGSFVFSSSGCSTGVKAIEYVYAYVYESTCASQHMCKSWGGGMCV